MPSEPWSTGSRSAHESSAEDSSESPSTSVRASASPAPAAAIRNEHVKICNRATVSRGARSEGQCRASSGRVRTATASA